MKPFGAALLTVLLTSCAAPAPSEFRPEEAWFRLAGPLESWLLHLRADGTFQFLRVSHFVVQEGLKGTWLPTGAEAATLRCDRWSRLIVAGPVRIRFGREWELQRPRIRAGLSKFLARHETAESFSKEEFEEAVTWSEDREFGKVTVMPLSSLEGRLPRAAVERLLPLLDAYGWSEDPREVHVLFRHAGQAGYLEWADWSGYSDPIPSDEIRSRIERAAPGGTVPDVWVKARPGDVERELNQKEGLRFFAPARPEK